MHRMVERERRAVATSPEGNIAGVYRGWFVVALGFLMLLFGAGPVYYAYGNYAVAFAEEFDAKRATINIGYSMLLIVGNLGSAPVGILADRWPTRRLAAVGVIGTAAGFAAVSMSDSILQIIVIFSTLIALSDICLGVVVTNFMVSHWFERRRGLAIGLSVLGASAAAVIFPPLTEMLIASTGWRRTFVTYAFATLALLPLVWWLAKIPPAIPAVERKPRTESVSASAQGQSNGLFASRPFWIISAATGVMIGVNAATMVSMVAFAIDRGFSGLNGSALISALGFSAMAGKIGFGVVADRIRLDYALRAGLAFQLAGVLAFAAGQGYAALLAGAVIFGLGVGGMLPVWGAIIAQVFGLSNYGRTLGWSRVVMTPISMSCPLAAGYIFDRTGDYAVAWAGFAALLAAAFALTFLWKDAGGRLGRAAAPAKQQNPKTV